MLIRPLKAGNTDASLLLQALMAAICLRRKKEMKFVDLRLPPLSEYVHRVKFHPSEREKYNGEHASSHPVTPIAVFSGLANRPLLLRTVCRDPM